jgi:hypothetical protein
VALYKDATGKLIDNSSILVTAGPTVTATGPLSSVNVKIDGALDQGRLQRNAAGSFIVGSNLQWDGTNFIADDVNKGSIAWFLVPGTTGPSIHMYDCPAGPNPRSVVYATEIGRFIGIKERGRTVAMGEWIDVPYSAANFTTNSAAPWTVTAVQQITLAYMLVGKTMFVNIWLNPTTLGTPAPTELRIKIPGGFLSAMNQRTAALQFQDAGWFGGIFNMVPGGNYIGCQKMAGGQWSGGASNIGIIGQAIIELQ